jgi:hypothetical protein
MRILTGEDEVRAEELERKIQRDLRVHPIRILCEGEFVSYEHDPDSDPIIKNIKIRYNHLEYVFHISKIDIDLLP